MNKSPAFQFYPSDWLGSQRVSLMTLEEEGAYIRLLSYCWQHGSVPADPEAVARLIGKGASTTLASRVLTMFQPPLVPPLVPPLSGGNVLVHERLEEERNKQLNWKMKSSEGGKKSAELRKARVVEPPLQPPYQPNGNSSSSSSIDLSNDKSTPDKESGVVVKKQVIDDAWIADLKRHYPTTDIDQELRNMDAWIAEHPNRRKTRRFIIGWLNRNADTLPKQPEREATENDYTWD